MTASTLTLLSRDEWRPRAAAHRERARRWTVPYRERRSRGQSHPVHDFLFQYYGFSSTKLEEWHPGPAFAIEDSEETQQRFPAPWYRSTQGVRLLSPERWTPAIDGRVARAVELMERTGGRRPNLGCFGMHEWAMVYRDGEVRHEGTVPLRLPQETIDELVEGSTVVCTHFDAFRFFAPAARSLNRVQPTAHTRSEREQPGCVHANMDLYQWAYQAMPWLGSDLLWEGFQLATELRHLDMRASPYDLRDFDLEPIPIETKEGRAEYQRRQAVLADRAQDVRARLIDALRSLSGRFGTGTGRGEGGRSAEIEPTRERATGVPAAPR